MIEIGTVVRDQEGRTGIVVGVLKDGTTVVEHELRQTWGMSVFWTHPRIENLQVFDAEKDEWVWSGGE
jgi:hypothetical protein